MVDFVGQRFGEYQLSTLLGKGSFSDVYLGEHIHEHTPAAVKVLQARLSAQDLKEFIQEASTIFRLKHPHIVQLLAFGIGKDDTPYLAMNYAPHGTLRNRYPKGTRLQPEILVSYITPIASALQYAHDRGIIHRDIKPENILLGPQDEIWLSDFGIAVVAQSSRLGDTPTIGGTVPYMAPEQLQGKPQFASDQYALGIMVYEWLCGAPPFKGQYMEIAMQHMQAPLPSLLEKVPSLSADIEQVVMTALAKDPQQRFANVQAFATALSQCGRDESTLVISEKKSSSPATPADISSKGEDISSVLIFNANEAEAETKRIEPNPPFSAPIVAPSVQPAQPIKSEGMSIAQRPQRKALNQRLFLVIGVVLILIVVGASLLARNTYTGNSGLSGSTHDGSQGSTRVATPLVDSKIAEAAAQRYQQGVATNGVMFGFDAQHTNVNPYEQVLSPTTVGNLKQAWSISGYGNFQGSPTIAYGKVYIGSDDHNFYAFDVKTGDFSWKQHTEGIIHSTAAVVGGVVYVGSEDGNLYAFDALNGATRWSTNLGVSVMGSPTVVNGIVYVNANTLYPSNNYLYALNTSTGSIRWEQKFPSYVSVPVVADGVVYVTGALGFSGSGPVWAYDARTGNERWNTLSTLSQCGGNPTIANGVVFVNCNDGNLYALDAQKHNQRWTASGGSWEGPDVAIESSIVYVNTANDLYARNANTGISLGPVLTQKAGSPIIGNGVIYTCARDGYLYAFDITTKAKLWRTRIVSFFIDNNPFPTPVVANGMIYINVGQLLAFGLPG